VVIYLTRRVTGTSSNLSLPPPLNADVARLRVKAACQARALIVKYSYTFTR
jgi:hypothetical protein